MEEASKYDRLDLTPPSRKPSKYDYHLLELGRAFYEASQTYVLNPRDIHSQSLFTADRDWCNDLNLHLAWVKHKRDKIKAAKNS